MQKKPIIIVLIICIIYCLIFSIAYPMFHKFLLNHSQLNQIKTSLSEKLDKYYKCYDIYKEEKAKEEEEIIQRVKQQLVNTEINNKQYYIENSKYYTILNNKSTEIISINKACQIAMEEAKNEKYNGNYNIENDNNGNAIISLKPNLDYISHEYFWNKEWKSDNHKDGFNSSYYNYGLLWKVKLYEETNNNNKLFIYLDAQNGEVLGAGST